MSRILCRTFTEPDKIGADDMTVSPGFKILVLDRITENLLIEVTNMAGTDEAEAMMKHISDLVAVHYPDCVRVIDGDLGEAIAFYKTGTPST